MKLSDVVIGGIVYFKRSSRYMVCTTIPFKVLGIEQRKTKFKRVILEGFEHRVSSGELTDVPCEQMTCEKCKYHPREVDDEKVNQ